MYGAQRRICVSGSPGGHDAPAVRPGARGSRRRPDRDRPRRRSRELAGQGGNAPNGHLRLSERGRNPVRGHRENRVSPGGYLFHSREDRHDHGSGDDHDCAVLFGNPLFHRSERRDGRHEEPGALGRLPAGDRVRRRRHQPGDADHGGMHDKGRPVPGQRRSHRRRRGVRNDADELRHFRQQAAQLRLLRGRHMRVQGNTDDDRLFGDEQYGRVLRRRRQLLGNGDADELHHRIERRVLVRIRGRRLQRRDPDHVGRRRPKQLLRAIGRRPLPHGGERRRWRAAPSNRIRRPCRRARAAASTTAEPR